MTKLIITAGLQILKNRGTGVYGVKENGVQFDEAKEARKLANAVIAHQKKWYGNTVLTDNDTHSLQSVVNGLKLSVNEKTVLLDIHFNASANPSATGCEVIIDVTHTATELVLAKKLAEAVSKALFIPAREGKLRMPGVKLENEGQHPSLAIISGPYKAINLLLEVCFVSNPKDVAKYRSNYNDLVKNISDVLGNFVKAQAEFKEKLEA